MQTQIAIQLYTLRDVIGDDFPSALKKIKDIGYDGVEAAGFYGYNVKEFKQLVEDAGLQIVASHSPWANRGDLTEAIETARTFGLDVVAGGFGKDAFADLASINATCEHINAITDDLKKADLKLYLHNHAWEFDRHDGQWGHSIVAEQCPDALFEIDTYWAANFGAENPAEVVTQFAPRIPYLHIKDGPLTQGAANLAVGSGAMDIPAVLKAAEACPLRALIVEFDRCDTDIWEAVAQSYTYLSAAASA
jgi:sugar phosphate isomerase/epimerase